MNSAFFENYIVSEIINYNAGQELFLYYFRDKDMKEIDIIMKYDG